jgi:hypothetical protein
MAYKYNPFTDNLDLVNNGDVATEAFTSQTSVTVTHNFNNYPVVQVLDASNVQIIPLSVTHDSVDAFTVTFTASTTGTIIATYGNPAPATSGFSSYVEITNDYTILTTDDTIKATGNNKITATLPTASGVTGKQYKIKHENTKVLDIEPQTGEFIEGVACISVGAGNLGAYPNVDVESDGTGWMIV